MPVPKASRYKILREFGVKVAVRRRELGLSQRQLADRIGIGQDALSRVESGLIAPKFSRLQDYADALCCPLADLFRYEDEAERDSSELFAQSLHMLSPRWQATLKRVFMDMASTARREAELTETEREESPREDCEGTPAES